MHSTIMAAVKDGKGKPDDYMVDDQTIKDREMLMGAFSKQLEDVKNAMNQRSMKRERPVKPMYIPPIDIELTEEERAEQRDRLENSQPVESDQLADLPDLDPSSAAAYKEFCIKEEENQRKQQALLDLVKQQTEQLEVISDESKKQDELLIQQGQGLEEAIELGEEVNAAADEFLEEHGEGGCSKCKCICYTIMIVIILGGGYYVYSNKDKLTVNADSRRSLLSKTDSDMLQQHMWLWLQAAMSTLGSMINVS